MKKDDHLIFEAYNSNKVRWVKIKDGIYTTHKANIMGKIVEIDNQAGFPYAVTIHHSDRKETVDFDKFDGWRIKSIKEYLQQTNLDKGIPRRSDGVASGEVLPMDIDKINELYYQHKSKLLKESHSEEDAENTPLSNSENIIISHIQAQKDMYKKFDVDYSKGVTFSNNLLALYGIGKRGRFWLTDFANDAGDPLPREKIENILKKVGLGKLINSIPQDYDSSEGFQGSHA